MSLLPPQFQTPLTHALGAKVVAITPAPKPHVHQWVPVPDSKVHCRCADCGAVTLTEAVNTVPPAAVAPATPYWAPVPGMPGMRKAVLGAVNGNLSMVTLHCGSGGGSANGNSTLVASGGLAGGSGTTFPSKWFTAALTADTRKSKLFDELIEAIGRMPKDEWRPNYGTQPVADNVLVAVRANGVDHPAMRASEFNWSYPLITHWKPA
jgi:hypothetical protein